jgi:predicted membrane chloride channel (bestrophin family)
LETVFGLGYLNYEVLPNKGLEVNNFYIIKKLNLQLTPATFIGIAIGIYYLYKSNN